MTQYAIRPAEKRDAPELARMFRGLGHVIDADSVSERWDEWAEAGNTALVAEGTDGEIMAVATLHQMMVLHRPKPVGSKLCRSTFGGPNFRRW